MNEDRLRERLREAAPDDVVVDVAADIARGKQGLARRRRRLAVGGSVAALAVVTAAGVGAGQLIGDESAASKGGAPIAGQTTSPTVVGDHRASPVPDRAQRHGNAAGAQPPSPTLVEGSSRIPDSSGSEIGYNAWRSGLYQLARQHLDPDGDYLNYSTRSLQGGSSGASTSLGIKLGWSQPNDAGEGMIQLEVAAPGGMSLLFPCAYFGPCDEVQVPGHGTVTISGDPTSDDGYAVRLTQDDGEHVQIIVDPLFGNNSLTPTEAPLVALDRVLDLAQDPDFDLP